MLIYLIALQAQIDQFDANFVSMLPLAKFLTNHSNQLALLSQNAGLSDAYTNFCRKVYGKGAHVINDFIDHLASEHLRFVPEDGNVHEITSNTINFMKILSKYQNVVFHVLENAHKRDGNDPVLEKLFCKFII